MENAYRILAEKCQGIRKFWRCKRTLKDKFEVEDINGIKEFRLKLSGLILSLELMTRDLVQTTMEYREIQELS